jgi:hypothetical protein
MAEDLSTNSWGRALSFYDSLSGPGWAHIPAFRAMVSALADSEEARGLTAITSHEVLTISPYTRYPDWFAGRRVQLHPRADGTVRVVTHSERANESWRLPLAEAQLKVLALLPDL